MVVKWTLATTKDIMKQAAEERKSFQEQSAAERKSWQESIMSVSSAINANIAQAKAFHEQVNEAHKYQREEHQRLAENQNSTCASLKQVEQALGRINGYHKE
jgi:hypothetical protein